MRPKVLLAIVATVWVVLFGAWFVATPYLSVWSLERAAAAGDVSKISDHVDFEALRESIQANAAQRIQGVKAALPDNPLAQLGASLATAFSQTVVDAAVTPETVAQMLHGAAPGASGGSGPMSDFDLSMGYSAFSRFVVEAKRQGSTDAPIQLIFTRSGLATWRLTSLRDPTLAK
ncbi:MAG TPA: DUF2939 domain-containing protein [Polyangiaceae bacterium]|jgi:hypothetical protein|nr:DUF2939 domain-containing protein [Polyangiaceae bacterium]